MSEDTNKSRGPWYVYVDRTDDGRPFYVGKGTTARVKKRERNSDWKEIAEKCGCNRSVEFTSEIESEAYKMEARLTEQYGTFNGWGANLRPGGYGKTSGWRHTRSTKELLRQKSTGKSSTTKGKKGKSPPNKGSSVTREHKIHLSELNSGNLSNRLGTKHTEETRQKMRTVRLGKKPCEKRFFDHIVDAMLLDRASGMLMSEIAKKYETTPPVIYNLFKKRKRRDDA